MKAKTVLYIGIALLFASLSVMYTIERDKRIKEQAARERLQKNQEELLKENGTLRKITLTDEEFKKTITKKIDSLIKVAGIKPKYVTNVIERHYYHSDTSSHEIPTQPDYQDGNKVYSFNDTSSCFTIGGYVRTFIAADPIVTINNRKFENPSVSIGYIERSRKFLGLIPYGPWKGETWQTSKCGVEETKEIQIIKKKRMRVKKE